MNCLIGWAGRGVVYVERMSLYVEEGIESDSSCVGGCILHIEGAMYMAYTMCISHH